MILSPNGLLKKKRSYLQFWVRKHNKRSDGILLVADDETEIHAANVLEPLDTFELVRVVLEGGFPVRVVIVQNKALFKDCLFSI